jgi:hypothetical protein
MVARVLAAPRQVWASAFQAAEPASKIAAAAAAVTMSLRMLSSLRVGSDAPVEH